MKKTLITAVSALLISTGGAASASTFTHANDNGNAHASYSHVQQKSNYGQQATQNIKNLDEYASIASIINPGDFTSRVTEDNVSKRVILFSDNYGRAQYKSIFVKKTSQVKVINLKGGGVILSTTVKAETPQKPAVQPQQPGSTISSLPEYNTLASKVDVSKLVPSIVSDNYNTRTILLKDANGRGQYKSIYVKRTGMLKIINLKGGQLYYGAAK